MEGAAGTCSAGAAGTLQSMAMEDGEDGEIW